MLGHLVRALCDVIIAHLDGELTPAVAAARSQIDRADNAPNALSQNHFGVQLEMLEPVDLDSDVIEDAQAADSLDELLLLVPSGGTARSTGPCQPGRRKLDTLG
jgi:hypothetical protein